MDNGSHLVGSTKPLIFADGTQILLGPLSDKDISELDNWVKSKYLHDARSSIPEDADEETKERIERIAQQTASTLHWYVGLGASIMVSIDGLAQLVYQSAKRYNEKISYDLIHQKLFLSENKDRANEVIDDINDLNTPLKKKRAEKKSQKKNISK